MKYVLSFLAVLACVSSVFAAEPTTGQLMLQIKQATGPAAPWGVTPVANRAVGFDGSGNPTSIVVGSGTVTSVALSLPSAIFDVAGSPVTSSGTLAVSLDDQSANTILAGPVSGGAAAPTFRALVAADIPSLTATYATAAQGVKADNVGAVNGLVKSNGSATFSAAVAGTDYVVPSGSITGNAATATALQTARTINGVSFDGTANITVTAAAGTLTGTILASNVTASSLLSAAGGSFGTAAFTPTTDYATAAQGTKADNAGAVNGIMKSNGSATFSAAVAGTDYLAPAAIGVTVQAFSSALNTFASNGSAFYLARANHTGTQAWSTITSTPTTLTGYGITDAQPLDSDLTAIAAVATTSYGRNMLALADASAGRSYLGLGTAAVVNTGTTSGTVPLLGLDGALTVTGVVTSPAFVATEDGGFQATESGFLVSWYPWTLTGNRTQWFPDRSGTVPVVDDNTGLVDVSDEITGILGIANGGTGINFTDPNADRLLFWDDSAGAFAPLTLGTNLSITGTTLDATGGGGATLGANTFTRLQTITQGTANEGILASTGYSLTGSSAVSMLDTAGTWNTSGTPTAWKLNVTDTASNAASLLMDLQLGGSPVYSFGKGGTLKFGGSPKIEGVASSAFNIFAGNSSNFYLGTNPGVFGGVMLISDTKLQMISSMTLSWSEDAQSYGTADLVLRRDAAGALAVRNSTNAQTFRVYNTYTDATTNERLNFGWSSNVGIVGTEKGSVGGTARDLDLQTDGTTRLKIKSTGQITLPAGNMILSGTGTPESAVTAPVGSIFLRTDGGANTTLYVKESGSGNTGWAAK